MSLEGRQGSSVSDDGIVTVVLRFESMRQFQVEFAPNLSSEGVFIPHPDPFPASTVIRFTVMLPGEFRLLEGAGVVLWTREEGRAGQPPGMALRFASLGPRSQELIDKLVETLVAEGGQPFELEPVAVGDELIPTDPLAGRAAMLQRRPLAAARARVPEDETPKLTVRDGTPAAPKGRLPEPGSPPTRPVTQPSEQREVLRDEPSQRVGLTDEVTAAELVAEVIADEESRSLGREADGGVSPGPGESDTAVDTFADSLRRLDHLPPSAHVGAMPEVTILPRDEDEVEKPARKVPWGALAAVAAVLAVAAVGFFAREPIARLVVPDSVEGKLGPDAARRRDRGRTPPAATRIPGVIAPTATVAASSPASVAAIEPTATPVAGTPTVEPTAAPPQPTATPVPAARPSTPAGRVVDIRWSSGEGRTVVTIVADGSLAQERVRVGTMSEPPRVLVRLLRVDRYQPYELAVGTSEVDRIRIGHHPEQSPPSLHVVLDLAGPGVKLESVDVVGAEVRLTVGR